MRRHLRRWGAIWIVGLYFAVALAGQAYFQVVLAGETAADFMAEMWANHESEAAQLLAQGVLFLALGHRLFKADKEDEERIESKLDALLAHHDSCPGLDRSHTSAAAETDAGGDDSNRWRYP